MGQEGLALGALRVLFQGDLAIPRDAGRRQGGVGGRRAVALVRVIVEDDQLVAFVQALLDHLLDARRVGAPRLALKRWVVLPAEDLRT